jgi:hypothetical protein
MRRLVMLAVLAFFAPFAGVHNIVIELFSPYSAKAAEWREATKSTLPWYIQMTTPAPARTESASRGAELALNNVTPEAVQVFLGKAVTRETEGFKWTNHIESLSVDELVAEINSIQLREPFGDDVGQVQFHQRKDRAWIALSGIAHKAVNRALCSLDGGNVRSCFIMPGAGWQGEGCSVVAEVSSRELVECPVQFTSGTGWLAMGRFVFEITNRVHFRGAVHTHEYVSAWGEFTNGGTFIFRNFLTWYEDEGVKLRACPRIEFFSDETNAETEVPCRTHQIEDVGSFDIRPYLSEFYIRLADQLRDEAEKKDGR